jgi:hypothetical protein
MKKTVSLLFLALSGSIAQADIIYSNLNPTTPFDTSNGSFVSSGGNDYSLSFSFSVQNHSYVVTSISFGAFLTAGGPNAIIATIYANNGGVPGAAVYTSPEIDNQLALTGATNTNDQDLITIALGGSVFLQQGQTYWLGLDNVSPDSEITWGYNGDGTVGNAALMLSEWTAVSREQGAFAIDGTIASPEPVSAGLLVSGLSALVFFRRKFVGRS